jgi:hypothetical protein
LASFFGFKSFTLTGAFGVAAFFGVAISLSFRWFVRLLVIGLLSRSLKNARLPPSHPSGNEVVQTDHFRARRTLPFVGRFPGGIEILSSDTFAISSFTMIHATGLEQPRLDLGSNAFGSCRLR